MYLDIEKGKCDLVVSYMEHLGDPIKNEFFIIGETNGMLDLMREKMDGVEVVVKKDEICIDEVNLGKIDGVLDSDQKSVDKIQVEQKKKRQPF